MGTHAVLMSCATNAKDPGALAIAGVLSMAFDRHGYGRLPLPGLDAGATRWLLAHWFPGADAALGLDWAALPGADRAEPRRDEIDDLVSLLRSHAEAAAGSAEESDAIAHALACASLGKNHLWEDLHLPSRRELSWLIAHWFPRLAALNTHNMKWKRFLYKQLCLREELLICKAPSCGVCSDHGMCFGPEEASTVAPH
ncbi:MAG: nitrogen fixation protein NifQ [Burkholderiaceae bacterium]|nr:nitrogen fixation protein NifQ [Burkholderiaceae bacterium]